MNRINEDIKTGQWKQMYLLYGEEAYLRKQYRDRLKAAIAGDDAMNCNFYEGKNLPVGEVIDLAETLPFFADRRLIVIQRSLQSIWQIRRKALILSLWRQRWTSGAVCTRP